jgi:hypothetical protein
MKFKEAREILTNGGFKLEYIQTGYVLPILSFVHPNYNNVETFVTFDDKDFVWEENLVIDFEKDDLDVDVSEVLFNQDLSIIYSIDEYLHDERDEPNIRLEGESLKYLQQIVDMTNNSESFFNFSNEYHQQVLSFTNKCLPFIKVLNKYGFNKVKSYRSGGLYNFYGGIMHSVSDEKNFGSVTFVMNVLDWNNEIGIDIDSTEEYDDSDCIFNIDADLNLFEKNVVEQIERRNKFLDAL